MSECVVRMEMPGCCYDCPCLDDYGDYPRCRISNEQRGYNFPIYSKRMPGCPILQPLPDRHGRLVDAEQLRQVLVVYKETDALGHTPLQLCDATPTIVPATEGRKEGRNDNEYE